MKENIQNIQDERFLLVNYNENGIVSFSTFLSDVDSMYYVDGTFTSHPKLSTYIFLQRMA